MSTITDLCTEIADKIPQLYGKGKQDERENFWDEALKSSNNIGRFAGRSWTKNNFNPTKDVILNGLCNYCFYNSGIEVDLIEFANELGITINIKPTSSWNMFQYSAIKGVRVDFTECTDIGNAFADATNMENIVLELKEDGTNTFSGTFTNCTKLKSLRIESGFIAKNINFQSSPLTKASIYYVFAHLSPDTETEFTVTFNKAAVDAAFETSEGSADGSTSAEWEEIVSRLPHITFSLV